MEIDDVIQRCYDAQEGGSAYPGMSYEEGALALLDWITGQSDDPVFDDE